MSIYTKKAGYLWRVTFTRRHTHGTLKGLESPDRVVSFPTRQDAEAFAADIAGSPKVFADIVVEENPL